jgi:hypothetical protein
MSISWQIVTVEGVGELTKPSLAFSPSGQPAIAFYSSAKQSLRFATLNDVGTWTIVAFRFGRPAISYGVLSAKELRYAHFRGWNVPWSIESVAPGGSTSSLAFDSAQRVGISYYEPDSKTLRYAQNPAPSTWISQPVDENPDRGFFNSLAFTSTQWPYTPPDRPGIAYHDKTHDQIKYAYSDGTTWFRGAPVGQGIGACSLAFDRYGQPHVAFTTGIASGGSNFVYCSYADEWQGSSWVGLGGPSVVGDGPCFAFAPDGTRVVSYHDFSAWAIKYAENQDFVSVPPWNISLVEKAGKTNGQIVGDFGSPSLAFSPSGQPAISYYDRGNFSIKYAVGSQNLIVDLISCLRRFLTGEFRGRSTG